MFTDETRMENAFIRENLCPSVASPARFRVGENPAIC